MIMKHTPGPWVTSPEPNGKEWVVDAGPWGICVCAFAPGLGTAEANARLIAAAPELLEALETLLGFVENKRFPDTIYVRNAINEAEAVIAKATGSV